MTIRRLAVLCVHTSPLASLGGEKTGGMNVYVREFALEFARRGIHIDIYTRKTAPKMPVVDHSLGENIRVIYVRSGPERPLIPDEVFPYLSQFTAGVLAFSTAEDIRYDAIYSHYWLSGYAAYHLREVWGTPFVQMFHTLGHMKKRIARSPDSSLTPDTRIHYETKITGWANYIIAATPAEQSQLLWLYRADRRKIVVIPPGVNTEHFRPLPSAQARERLGIPAHQKLLLFVGRIEPLKGVDNILRALHLIYQARPDLLDDARLVVIGGDVADSNNYELTRLRQMSEQFGLARIVEFVGAKEQHQLPYYYAAALAVIMPSDYESFGLVALEAMACGAPVIASQVGGLAFLIQDGKTGFLVPVREPAALAERITFLLNNPQFRRSMGQAAAALAQSYGWSAIADRLLSVFAGVIERPRLTHHKRSGY
jgi:D-inositol-3-phosphate glycosyltransferase